MKTTTIYAHPDGHEIAVGDGLLTGAARFELHTGRHPLQADRALQVGPLQAARGYVHRAKDRRRPGAIAHQWGQGWQAAQPEPMSGGGKLTLRQLLGHAGLPSS